MRANMTDLEKKVDYLREILKSTKLSFFESLSFYKRLLLVIYLLLNIYDLDMTIKFHPNLKFSF